MKKLAGFYKFVSPMLLVTTIVLIIQIYTLPNKISSALGGDIAPKDTMVVVESDKLPIKKDLIYFSGTINSKQVQINKQFQYNPDFPSEYWDGWLTLCTSQKGGKYFIWSKDKIENTNMKFNGWCVSLNGSWQHVDKEYLSVLLPVVERVVD